MSTLRVALLLLVCVPTLACRTQDALDVSFLTADAVSTDAWGDARDANDFDANVALDARFQPDAHVLMDAGPPDAAADDVGNDAFAATDAALPDDVGNDAFEVLPDADVPDDVGNDAFAAIDADVPDDVGNDAFAAVDAALPDDVGSDAFAAIDAALPDDVGNDAFAAIDAALPDDVGNDAFEVVPVDTGLILLDAEVAMAMRAYSGR